MRVPATGPAPSTAPALLLLLRSVKMLLTDLTVLSGSEEASDSSPIEEVLAFGLDLVEWVETCRFSRISSLPNVFSGLQSELSITLTEDGKCGHSIKLEGLESMISIFLNTA